MTDTHEYRVRYSTRLQIPGETPQYPVAVKIYNDRLVLDIQKLPREYIQWLGLVALRDELVSLGFVLKNAAEDPPILSEDVDSQGEKVSGQIKVTYIPREHVHFFKNGAPEFKSQAYVDEDTLFGTDKHSDVELQLEFDIDRNMYIQIDDWEWDFDDEGTPTKRTNS